NGAVNRDRFRLHLAANLGIFSDDKHAFRLNLSFDLPVENQLISEFDGALDDDIVGENIFGGAAWGGLGHKAGGQIVEVHVLSRNLAPAYGLSINLNLDLQLQAPSRPVPRRDRSRSRSRLGGNAARRRVAPRSRGSSWQPRFRE